jgi:hypothetical protein
MLLSGAQKWYKEKSTVITKGAPLPRYATFDVSSPRKYSSSTIGSTSTLPMKKILQAMVATALE